VNVNEKVTGEECKINLIELYSSVVNLREYLRVNHIVCAVLIGSWVVLYKNP
jgi:hypothetical protein